MNLFRVYKIADVLFDKIIFAADKIKYIPDPNHEKNPGSQYHKTKKGWYLNKDKETETTSTQNISLTQQEQSYLSKYMQNNGKFNTYGFITDLGGFNSVRTQVNKEYQVDGKSIETKINYFSGSGYGETTNAVQLANLAAWHFNLGKGDYRTQGKLGAKPNDETLKEYAQYLKREQQVLKRAGLVTKDGKVRLFRNVGKSLFKYHTDGINIDNFTDHIGETMQYRGSHIQSWTFKPDLSWDGAKIYAEVPLQAVVASFVGRKGHKISFQHMHECECMICSSLVHEVQLVGKDYKCNSTFEKKYYQEIGQSYEMSPQEREEFEKLSYSSNPDDMIKLLKHKGMTTEKLNNWVKNQQNPQVLSQMASSNLADEKTMETLAEKESEIVLKKVLDYAEKNKNMNLLKKLSQSKNTLIQTKAKELVKPMMQQIITNQSPYDYKKYVLQSNADADILDAVYEKNKDIGYSTDKSKYVYQTVKSQNIHPQTLEKVLTHYNKDMNLQNVEKIINQALSNKKVTPSMIDKLIDGDVTKAFEKNGTIPSYVEKLTHFSDLSSKSLSWIVKQCKKGNISPSSEMMKSQNINDEMVDLAIKKLPSYFSALMENENLTEDMLKKISNDYHCKGNQYAYIKIMEHPSCTLDVCESIKKNNADDKDVVNECDKYIKEKYKQVSEKISDEQPEPEDIQKMKQLFPESCKGKTMEQLIILFKTLMKRGYWDKAVNVAPDTQEMQENEGINDEEDTEINDYLKKMLEN